MTYDPSSERSALGGPQYGLDHERPGPELVKAWWADAREFGFDDIGTHFGAKACRMLIESEADPGYDLEADFWSTIGTMLLDDPAHPGFGFEIDLSEALDLGFDLTEDLGLGVDLTEDLDLGVDLAQTIAPADQPPDEPREQ